MTATALISKKVSSPSPLISHFLPWRYTCRRRRISWLAAVLPIRFKNATNFISNITLKSNDIVVNNTVLYKENICRHIHKSKTDLLCARCETMDRNTTYLPEEYTYPTWINTHSLGRIVISRLKSNSLWRSCTTIRRRSKDCMNTTTMFMEK
jgi:hypothetical protein